MAQIVWSETALQELDNVADFIALDNPGAANRLVRKVFKQIDLLEDFPEMCPVPHDLRNSRYRHLVIRPLRIFHRIEDDIVFIVYIMRSDRNVILEELESRDT